LRYGNVLYMPVDWSIATKVFGWTYTETKTTGFLLGGPKFVATHRQAVALGVIENRAKKNMPIPAVSSAIVHSRQTVAVGQRNIACEIVTVDMKAGGLQAETVLAGGAIGKTGTLEAAAKANGALFAINGTFFDAYNGYGTPSNVLVSQGKLVTTGGYYGALGINGTQAKVDRVQALVDGENTGKVFDYVSWYNGKWYGLSLNTPHIHFGDSRIVLFDRNHHGKIKTHKGFVGYYFTVNQGIISEPKKVTSEIDHKADYTIVFPATVSHPNLDINTVAKDPKLLNATQHVYSNYAKFAQGATFGAQPVVTNIKDIGDRKQLEKTDPFWKTVETVVGAGPLLVKGGKIAIDFTQESFGEKKITTDSGRRSVAGIKADGTLIFVIADGTVDELAEVMIRLGAVDATCFDGGGSSGMYLNGKTIVRPGRELSNILIFKGK
ncbi:MAG: phosphodiester glycosidase family protein, partial [Bacillota bacterium]|nr:phosphodiester glycosidase family protein [Bacillota bacterium]